MSKFGTGEAFSAERLKEMREAELIDFIRTTVVQLSALGDRLEAYVQTKVLKQDPDESEK